MRSPTRLLTAGLLVGLAFTTAVATVPASAATACTESQSAKAVRKAVKASLRIEIDAYRDQRSIYRGSAPTKEREVAAILADPAKTASEKGIAQADLDLLHGVGSVIDDSRSAALLDRGKLSRCGLPAMVKLTRHTLTRQGDYAVEVLQLSRTNSRALLKWDTVTRDSYAGVDDTKYAEYDGKVKADQAAVDSATGSIKDMRKLFRTLLKQIRA